ncbi:hypothetical protein C0995_011055, partial [Termitomyces sp. Mi166
MAGSPLVFRKEPKVSCTAIVTSAFHLQQVKSAFGLRQPQILRPSRNGFDLMRPDGELPWSIPLLLLKSPFKELAIQEDLIDSIIIISGRKGLSSALLTFLEQPFVINLEATMHPITILTPQGFTENPAVNRFFRKASRSPFK